MKNRHNRIYLMGFMGSGKSVIGRKLSSILTTEWIDLDQFIEEEEQLSISEIFESQGESAFRKIESKALVSLLYRVPRIISLGGGTPCHQNNIRLINNTGISFYLEVSPETLAKRLIDEKDHRPVIAHAEDAPQLLKLIGDKLKLRQPYYSKAHHIIDGEQDVERIVHQIIDLLNS